MRHNLFILMLAGLSAASLQSNAQTSKKTVNYLSIPGQFSLQKTIFTLAFSAHPEPNFYKQEYLAAGDAFPKYKSMLTIDFLVGETTVEQAVATKVKELEQLKKANYDVRFEFVANPPSGEKILDCVIAQTSPNELTNLVERDVYRFKNTATKSGQKGIILLAASNRKYGKEVKPYLAKLKTEKAALADEILKFHLPEINITK